MSIDVQSINANRRVGELAAQHPLATRVFEHHGIDYCCGGGRPLAEACRSRGLDAEEVVAQIRRELEAGGDGGERWDEVPLEDLVRHIVNDFHRPLAEELPRLQAMARKVLAVHGDKRPDILAELLSTFLSLEAELQSHMMKEEQVLFPMIERGQGAMAGGPIAVMEDEHDSASKALSRIRELTDGYRVPPEACNTWRALWHRLEELERSLHEHIHLENNILFPRALAG